MIDIIVHTTALVVLFFASIADLKTREVPDLLNYGLILFGLTMNASLSILLHNPYFILNSLSALLLFVLFSLILFYTGQWGGGDSKLLAGLAALIGIPIFPFANSSYVILRIMNSFLFNFIINLLFIGALYGLSFTIYLMFKHKKKFIQKFISTKRRFSRITKLLSITGIILLIPLIFLTSLNKGLISSSSFVTLVTLISVIIFFIVLVWTHIFVKAVELSSLYKKIQPEKLTEGDWIAKDIYYKKEYVAGHKDLGVDDKQIRKLIKLKKMKKLNFVVVRDGIPFIPSFFFAYIFTLIIKTNFILLLFKFLNLS